MTSADLNIKIGRNALYQIVGKSVSTLLGLIAVALMTRYLGKEGFGNYTTIIAYLQFFGILVDLGLTIVTVQMIAERPAETNKIVSNIMTLRLVSAVIFLGLAPLIIWFFPYASLIKIGVAITTLSFFFITLNQILIGVFQKELRTDKVALAEVIGRIFLVIFVFLAVTNNLGLLAIMTAIVLGSLANFIVNYLFSLKYVRLKLSFESVLWREILSKSWPIGLAIIFNLIYLKADTIILSLVRPQSEVGLYGAPYRVLEIIMQFPFMFIGIILPLLSAAWKKRDTVSFRHAYQLAFDVLSLMAIPLAFGTYFVAEKMMVLVAGQDFFLSGAFLRILMLAIVMMFWGTLFGHAIVALNKQKVMVLGYIITAIVALSGYLFVIPKYGAWGAAWMTVASETLITILTFLVVTRVTKILPSFKAAGKAFAASLVMSLVLYRLPGTNLFTLLIISLAVYALVLYLLKGYSLTFIKKLARLRVSKKI